MRVDAEAVSATVGGTTAARPRAPYRASASGSGSSRSRGGRAGRSGGLTSGARPGASTLSLVAEGSRPYAAAARLPAELDAGLDRLTALDLDGFGVGEVQRLLGEVNGRLRRLEAARTRIAGVLRAREMAARGHGKEAQAERAAREFLTGELGISGREATDISRTGRRLKDAPDTAGAFAAGRLSQRHASVITDALRQVPADSRARLEAELVELAQRLDPVALGRHARKLIAREDLGAAKRGEQRRHLRRRFSWSDTEQGGLRFHGELYGIEAEQARVAFDAFTPTPQSGDGRSHDQRRADGLIAMAGAALRAGEAPTQHGVRPHVLLLVRLEDAVRGEGLAELASGEPATLRHLRPWLRDSDIARVVFNAKGVPIEVGTVTRNVPAGLYRALQARDGGCTWQGCDVPLAWCDVAHGEDPFAAGGMLSPANAALLCRHHHRQFDYGGWWLTVDGSTVTYHRDPSRPSARELVRRARSDAGTDHKREPGSRAAGYEPDRPHAPPPERPPGRPPDPPPDQPPDPPPDRPFDRPPDRAVDRSPTPRPPAGQPDPGPTGIARRPTSTEFQGRLDGLDPP